MVASSCRLIEPEKCHSIDEEIIPSKTKHVKFVNTNTKIPKIGLLRTF